LIRIPVTCCSCRGSSENSYVTCTVIQDSGGAHVCWFCSDCCWSLQHLSRMANVSQFMATHGN